MEVSGAAAASAIRSLIGALEASSDLRIDAIVRVREEDGDQFLESTLTRELQVLSSHTIHHFALLALNDEHKGANPLRLERLPQGHPRSKINYF